jgi:hypothetical protein
MWSKSGGLCRSQGLQTPSQEEEQLPCHHSDFCSACAITCNSLLLLRLLTPSGIGRQKDIAAVSICGLLVSANSHGNDESRETKEPRHVAAVLPYFYWNKIFAIMPLSSWFNRWQ